MVMEEKRRVYKTDGCGEMLSKSEFKLLKVIFISLKSQILTQKKEKIYKNEK